MKKYFQNTAPFSKGVLRSVVKKGGIMIALFLALHSSAHAALGRTIQQNPGSGGSNAVEN